MTIVTVGIDWAKNVFAVHGVDATGKPALTHISVPRGKLLALIATFPPCLIGMEPVLVRITGRERLSNSAIPCG